MTVTRTPTQIRANFAAARINADAATMLGIWHIDRNGELCQFYKADPFRGKGRNLFDRQT